VAKNLLVGGVGQPGVGDTGLAPNSASSCPWRSSRLSISVSTRETKNDATEWIWDRSWPASWPAPARPGRRPSPAVPLHGEDQRDVDEMPSAITAVIAGRPASVAGILISRFGRSTIFHSSPPAGWSSVSLASRGRPRWTPGRRRRRRRRTRAQQVAGVADVVGGDGADGGVDVGAGARPARRPARRRRSPSAAPPAKIDGLVVTPDHAAGVDQLGRLPVSSRSRDRSSSHIETPAADSAARFMGFWVMVVAFSLSDAAGCPAAAATASAVKPNSRKSRCRSRRGAVVLDGDDLAGVADDRVPPLRDAGLDATRAFTVGGRPRRGTPRLGVEPLHARHRDHRARTRRLGQDRPGLDAPAAPRSRWR
jgi:hypothetical protein